MRTGRGRAAGAFAVATVVLAGVWLWAASGGEEPPLVVASVQLVEDDDAREPGERPSVRTVRPDEDGLTVLQPSAGAGAAAHPGEPLDLTEHTVGGYEGWWSSDGNGEACDAFADAHPEVVLVSTRTGEVDESGWRLDLPVDCVPPSETH